MCWSIAPGCDRSACSTIIPSPSSRGASPGSTAFSSEAQARRELTEVRGISGWSNACSLPRSLRAELVRDDGNVRGPTCPRAEINDKPWAAEDHPGHLKPRQPGAHAIVCSSQSLSRTLPHSPDAMMTHAPRASRVPNRVFRCNLTCMFSGKPIIGISGGIGSGKSFVAGLFGELGCLVIDSDEQVRRAYALPEVRECCGGGGGRGCFGRTGGSTGGPSRPGCSPIRPSGRGWKGCCTRWWRGCGMWRWPPMPPTRKRLPSCGIRRYCSRPACTGSAMRWCSSMHPRTCGPGVREGRGWDAAELARRENLQWPLDRKREISDHQITNTASADEVRGQVRKVLSRILARSPRPMGL